MFGTVPVFSVPVWMSYRTYRSVRYRYESLDRYRRYRYSYRTELTEVSSTGNTGGIRVYRRYASVHTVPNTPLKYCFAWYGLFGAFGRLKNCPLRSFSSCKRLTGGNKTASSYSVLTQQTKDVGCRSNFDPSRPLYTQDTSFSVKSSLTAVRQGAKVPSSDIFATNLVIRCLRCTKILLGWKTYK